MRYDVPGAAAELARWQAGVMSRQQLLGVGLTPQMITTRVERDRWQTLYRGVYAVFTGPQPRDAWLWAALLRAGPLDHHGTSSADHVYESAVGSRPEAENGSGRRRCPGLGRRPCKSRDDPRRGLERQARLR